MSVFSAFSSNTKIEYTGSFKMKFAISLIVSMLFFGLLLGQDAISNDDYVVELTANGSARFTFLKKNIKTIAGLTDRNEIKTTRQFLNQRWDRKRRTDFVEGVSDFNVFYTQRDDKAEFLKFSPMSTLHYEGKHEERAYGLGVSYRDNEISGDEVLTIELGETLPQYGFNSFNGFLLKLLSKKSFGPTTVLVEIADNNGLITSFEVAITEERKEGVYLEHILSLRDMAFTKISFKAVEGAFYFGTNKHWFTKFYLNKN